ncbi:lytic transglycosylase domain-containing protein [Geomonas sp.]|uniref:lytic transglycosylase domain-containing protein n=1 Tax=Geomonas sp. TaxID=2651584 RepID=UPI002B4626AE|nr:lytic transglycosylase domain-containing protein [Geomonas sp.]HJV34972.1 lytic transglycosylase domain-containing protein [Geomonas sp.]
MSIEPVANAQNQPTVSKGTPSAPAAAVPFEEYLPPNTQSAPVSASTAAEILRLKMLSSAMSIGDDKQKGTSTTSAGIQGILDRFLEQLPKGGVAGAGASGESVGSGEAAASGELVPVASAPIPSEGPTNLQAIIDKAARRYGVDGGLIKAVIKAESDFNPRAVSPVGAQGLMQLMPSTARGLGVTDAFDPEQNVMAGTRFLKDMLTRYGGNIDEALAAYNWGPGNVDRHGTDTLPRETRAYLGKVKGLYSQYMA